MKNVEKSLRETWPRMRNPSLEQCNNAPRHIPGKYATLCHIMPHYLTHVVDHGLNPTCACGRGGPGPDALLLGVLLRQFALWRAPEAGSHCSLLAVVAGHRPSSTSTPTVLLEPSPSLTAR
jgi:hypothetical protein